MQLVIRETEYRTFSSFCMNIDNNLMNIFWVVLQKPRPPFRWRMVTACWPEAYRPQTGWNQRLKFQKYHPVTSPPTNQKGREMIIYPETFSPNIVLKNPCLKAIQGVQTIWARAACSPCLAPANKSFAVNTHCQEFGFLHRRHRSSCQVTVSNFFEEHNWDNRKKDPGPMWRKKKMKGKRKQDVSTLVWTLLWNGESRYQLKWKNKCRGKRRWWTSVPSGKEEGWGGVSGRFQSS